jgi:hypothetical protein
VVYNIDRRSVVLLQRTKHEPIRQQIDAVFQAARRYDAVVRGQAEIDEAVLKVLNQRGASVKRVDISPPQFSQAYENLSLLISYKQIKLPDDPELLVELEVGQNSVVRALCLVTHDIRPGIEAARYDLEKGRFYPDDVFSVLRGIRGEYGDDFDYYDYDY